MEVEAEGKARDLKVKNVIDLFVNLSIGITCTWKDLTVFLHLHSSRESLKSRLCFRIEVDIGSANTKVCILKETIEKKKKFLVPNH